MSVDPKILLVALLLGASSVAAISAAQNKVRTDASQPINIYARTIEIDDKTGVAWYRGDVSITDGEFSIKADRVQVVMREGEIEIFKAFGDPVDIVRQSPQIQKQMTAKAQRATYNAKTQTLQMFGQVELYQQGSELRCAEVHYDMQTGRFVGKGGKDQERCYIVMRPKDEEQRAAEKEAANK